MALSGQLVKIDKNWSKMTKISSKCEIFEFTDALGNRNPLFIISMYISLISGLMYVFKALFTKICGPEGSYKVKIGKVWSKMTEIGSKYKHFDITEL